MLAGGSVPLSANTGLTYCGLTDVPCMFHMRGMPRFAADHLDSFALRVLEEAVEQSRTGPARSWGARFALAYLANSREDRGPFDWLWLALGEENDIVRGQNTNASLNAVYRACGRAR